MFFFGLYTFVVWWLCAGYRRRWRGPAVLVLSLAGLWGLKLLVSYLVTSGSGEPTPVLDAVVVPYAVLLFLGGAYILSLPRRVAPWACPDCAYDLRGHDEAVPVCPECGPRGHLERPTHAASHEPAAAPVYGSGRA